MNTLNRILVVLAVLVLIPVCVAVLVAPIPILRSVSGGMDALVSSLEGVPAWAVLSLGVLFSLAWLVVCILFLVLELRRPRQRLVRVERVDGGEVEVGMRTVGEHVAYEVDRLPGVLRVRSHVSTRRGGVVIELDVDTAGDVEVPIRAAQVVEIVRQVVEEKVGVRLARPPKVRLRARPAPLPPRIPTRPWPEADESSGRGQIGPGPDVGDSSELGQIATDE